MTEVWELAGYDVQELLGFGATGEVWRAVHQATGDLVALKRPHDGSDPAALRREATALALVDSPHVVRRREVVETPTGVVLVLDHAAGGSLAGLLARRGRLSPGEVVTVAAPLAGVLSLAHARGLVHGDVSPANVLFTSSGMPVLADFGAARTAASEDQPVLGTAEYVDPVVAAGGRPDPSSDVWSLAALCHQALAGCPPHEGVAAAEVLALVTAGDRAPLGLLAPEAPRPLVAAIEQALSQEPGLRPDASTFALALQRACAPEPVSLGAGPAPTVAQRPTHVVGRPPAPDEVPSPPPMRRRLPQRAVVAVVAVAVLALAGVAGWASGSDVGGGATSLPSVTRSDAGTADWRVVVDGLDAARARAFAAGRPALLAEVHLAGSAPLAADTALLSGLASRGERAQGVRHELVSVGEVARDGDTVRLRVVDVLAAHRVLGPEGAVLLERREGSAATRTLHLRWREGRWLVERVEGG